MVNLFWLVVGLFGDQCRWFWVILAEKFLEFCLVQASTRWLS